MFSCRRFVGPSGRSSLTCKLGVDDAWLRLKRNCNGEQIPPSVTEASQGFFPPFFIHFYFTIRVVPASFKNHNTTGFDFFFFFYTFSRFHKEGLGRRKMGCLGNSKTEDQRIDEKAQRETNKKIEKQLQKERQAYKATHRLLLLGKADSSVIAKRNKLILAV